MRFVIAAGGTGGHLFPGVAVGEVLLEKNHEVMLITSEKEIDALATAGRDEFRIERMPGIGLQSKSPIEIARFLVKAFSGVRHCQRLFGDFQPSAVLGMGGFTSTAPILAGKRRGVPVFVHESNAYPGRANRLNARFVTKVLLGFEECARFFPVGKVEVTGTPIRRSLTKKGNRSEALARFGLDPARKTVLVMGGSQGATGINTAMVQAAAEFARKPIQIIHLTGKEDRDAVRAAYHNAGLPAYVERFCDQMELAYSAADIGVARSGAASLTEISHFGVPSILIPYPFAADDHQTWNAKIFEKAGAAELLPQKDVAGDVIARKVLSLLDDPARLEAMSSRCAQLSPGAAAERIADVMIRHCL